MSKNARKKFTAIDLFSGCGGLTEGLKQAGYQVLAAIELDSKAIETYQLNHPEPLSVKADIRDVCALKIMEQLELQKGELHLLAGCPPCQGFSTLRTRNRKTSRDKRNALIDDFLRFVEGMLPKYVMLENVPGLEKHHRFKSFVKTMRKLGYLVEHKILDVSHYDVPQRRKRLILLASRIGSVSFASKKEGVVSVREAFFKIKSSKIQEGDIHYIPERRSEKVKEVIRSTPKDGGSRKDLPESLKLKCHLSFDGFNDVYGRMKWDDISPTITSGCHNPSKGRFLHPEENRTITLREAAVLQGFSCDYIFKKEHGKEALGLMIGNALPPPFIKAHAEELKG